MMFGWMSLTAVSVLALLVAEHRGSRTGVWIAKPLASTAFVAAALAAGAASSSYGRMILAGLVLSWLGDVLLIPRERPKVFLAGVGSFLLGHVAFAIAFLARGAAPAWVAGAAVLVVAALAGVVRWLAPHLPGDMRGAAHAYMFVISVMVVTASGTFGAAGNAAILIGAVAFYFSDISVARDRFVEHAFVNRLWGLPLYYFAQLALAYSTAAG
jgi:uncharacterized membrane protein YhhN